MASSKLDNDQYDKLKEKGNAFFQSARYLEAAKNYIQAYQALGPDDYGEDYRHVHKTKEAHATVYKRAVIASNMSNCEFEMGKYITSTEAARKCIFLVDYILEKEASATDEDNDDSKSLLTKCRSLKLKNLLRRARCGIYGSVKEEGFHKHVTEPLQILSTCGDTAYEKRANRMLDQVQLARRGETKNAHDWLELTPIHRSSLYGSWMGEYYNYGHDNATSALECGYIGKDSDDGEPACEAILLENLPKKHLSNLSVLFGGVGDARHVYATLCDVNRQFQSLGEAKKKKFRMTMVLNDINATVLARDLIMMAALLRLGSLAPSFGEPNSEAFRWAVTVQYLFFGYVYPASVHDRVKSLMGDLLAEDLATLKNVIHASEGDWTRIRGIVSYWFHAEEGKDYFPTTALALDNFFKVHTRLREGDISRGRDLDSEFLLEVNAILPPRGSAGELYDQIWGDMEDNDYSGEQHERLFREAKEDIRSSWRVNRIMFCPRWTKFFEGDLPVKRFHPVAEIGSCFLHSQGIMESLSGDNTTALELSDVSSMNFFECSSLFFWNTARALVNLSSEGVVRFEVNIGSVTDLGRSIQEERPVRKFHRIFLSNIADYIGLLSIFTEIAPLLHIPSQLVPSFIQTNVLLNTQIWHSYSHYVYSATGLLYVEDAMKFLGMKYMSHDSVWIHQNQWTRDEDENKSHVRRLVSREELSDWLHRLLLQSILPPMRDPFEPSFEACPMNVATFLRTCVFCVKVLKQPAHWVGSILDDIITACSTGVLKTKAVIADHSPSMYQHSETINKINLQSFRLELLTQIEIWTRLNAKYLVPLVKLPNRGDCHKYRLHLWHNCDGSFLKVTPEGVGCGGKLTTLCVGLVLSKTKDPDGGGAPDDFLDRCPRDPVHGEGYIRNKAISGSDMLHVFSCVRFDRQQEDKDQYIVEFFMNEDDFKRYSSYFVYAIRADSWNQLGRCTSTGSMRLREAQRVSS